MQLKIDCTARSTSTITDYMVETVSQLITSGKLPSGTRLPSIRSFSKQNQVSRFTVVQVYDRLVADGLLQSRQGSGFYVMDTQAHAAPILIDDNASPIKTSNMLDSCQIMPNALHTTSRGTLPPQWLADAGLERAIRKVGRDNLSDFLSRYTDPQGYPPLRELIQQRLLGLGMSADTQQIITTSGALPAIELLCRNVLKAGEKVLVDEPGYYSFKSIIELCQAQAIGIPWHVKGPDLEQLETLLKKHKPALYITSAVNHNPTSITLEPSVIHQVLRLAEKYHFYVVEDDIFGVFHGDNPLRYATLDQFQQVIYINSYSKTLSGRLRVGYMALPSDLIPKVLKSRALYGRTSELAERVTYELLREGGYRKHVLHLIDHLQNAREQAIKNLDQLGFELFYTPKYGVFLWARHPNIPDSQALAIQAHKRQIDILPGHHFLVNTPKSPWMRFSVSWCNHPDIMAFFECITQKTN